MSTQLVASVIVTVDIVIPCWRGQELYILLIERCKPPFQGMWALPGGKLNADDISLERAAQREVEEETGVELALTSLIQVCTFGDVGRNPRGRYISTLYLVPPFDASLSIRAGYDARDVRWFPVSNLPPLAFDHASLLAAALVSLQRVSSCSREAMQRLAKTLGGNPEG